MRYPVAIIVLGLILAVPAQARMYQWVSPDSGRVQLAGSPPAWYRGLAAGPRVRVFENGELVDDTAVAVPEEQRAELRATAFGADDPAAPAPTAQAALESELDEAAAAPAQATSETAPIEPAPAPLVRDEAKAAELKALIDAWDQRQLEQARALLDLLPEREPSAPAR